VVGLDDLTLTYNQAGRMICLLDILLSPDPCGWPGPPCLWSNRRAALPDTSSTRLFGITWLDF